MAGEKARAEKDERKYWVNEFNLLEQKPQVYTPGSVHQERQWIWAAVLQQVKGSGSHLAAVHLRLGPRWFMGLRL